MLSIENFLKRPGVILDVRSPGEFLQGHIPGAINLPLFSDAEHAQVGTCYKQEGQLAAFELGMKLVTPKLTHIVRTARDLFDPKNPCLGVHCWRGGMRSSSVAKLLQECGLAVVTLKGGYKAFRTKVLSILATPRKFAVVGGLTGSGKTAILHALQRKSEAILDLEALACHRGSTFGAFPSLKQPTNEQFENEIACRLHNIPTAQYIWIEDEGRLIGTCKVPDPLFQQMQKAPLLFIEKPIEERLLQLANDYLSLDPLVFVEGAERIRKKLGGARTNLIKEHLLNERKKEAALLVLDYYDKTYEKTLKKRPAHLTQRVSMAGLEHAACAEKLSAHLKQSFPSYAHSYSAPERELTGQKASLQYAEEE